MTSCTGVILLWVIMSTLSHYLWSYLFLKLMYFGLNTHLNKKCQVLVVSTRHKKTHTVHRSQQIVASTLSHYLKCQELLLFWNALWTIIPNGHVLQYSRLKLSTHLPMASFFLVQCAPARTFVPVKDTWHIMTQSNITLVLNNIISFFYLDWGFLESVQKIGQNLKK